MTDYKALYEKEQERNKDLRDTLLDQLVSREETITTLKTMPVEDIFELMEMDSNRIKKLDEENKKLKGRLRNSKRSPSKNLTLRM